MTRHFWLVVAVIGWLPACGSRAADPTSIMPDADFVTCSGETRATPYQAGMQVTSSSGIFVLKVLSNTFTDANGKVLAEAPAKGVDVWTIEMDAEATMAPADGLTMSVSPFMPDHGHGTTAVGVTAAGAGTYTVSPLNLYMAGYWEIRFTITDTGAEGNVTDSAMVPI